MDIFLNSGGTHATACLVLAYVRPSIFKFSFGISYEYQTIKLNDVLTPERFSFILLSVVIHHLILFLLEAFQISFFLDILIRALLSAVFTIISCIIIIYLIKPNKDEKTSAAFVNYYCSIIATNSDFFICKLSMIPSN
jgi:hypothetical protein